MIVGVKVAESLALVMFNESVLQKWNEIQITLS